MVHAKMCLMGSYFHSCGCFEQSAHLLLVNVVRVALVIHRVEKLPPATITTFTRAISELSRSFKIKNLKVLNRRLNKVKVDIKIWSA